MRPKKTPNCTVSMWISLLIKFYHHNSALDLTNMHWYAKGEISKYFKDFIRSKCIPFPWVASSFPVRKYENLTEKKKLKNILFFAYFPCGKLRALETSSPMQSPPGKKALVWLFWLCLKLFLLGKKKACFVSFSLSKAKCHVCKQTKEKNSCVVTYVPSNPKRR